jgi:hypothetical protein
MWISDCGLRNVDFGLRNELIFNLLHSAIRNPQSTIRNLVISVLLENYCFCHCYYFRRYCYRPMNSDLVKTHCAMVQNGFRCVLALNAIRFDLGVPCVSALNAFRFCLDAPCVSALNAFRFCLDAHKCALAAHPFALDARKYALDVVAPSFALDAHTCASGVAHSFALDDPNFPFSLDAHKYALAHLG